MVILGDGELTSRMMEVTVLRASHRVSVWLTRARSPMRSSPCFRRGTSCWTTQRQSGWRRSGSHGALTQADGVKRYVTCYVLSQVIMRGRERLSVSKLG